MLFRTFLLATALLTAPALAQEAAPDLSRAAHGDLTQPGGARRIEGDRTEQFRQLIDGARPRNVILLIGDGMGDSEITVARNYAVGAGGYFAGIDALPVTGAYTHYSLNKDDHKPNYVTDSAASATAWAIGVKSYNGAIGVDVNGAPHSSILELAKAAGLATGDVTTAEIQDATPAALVAHVTSRSCYGPVATSATCPGNALENGGAGSITEQLLALRPDLVLGGGARSFDETATAGEWQGKTLFQQAADRGYHVVRNAAGLAAVDAADATRPLLGLFSVGTMPVRWTGPVAARRGNLDEAPIRCEVNAQRTADIPTLADMTTKAIALLRDRPAGFFLQVEGASIDKQDHAANPCGQIGETVDLDEAVQVALQFAREQGDTLVIVTADHAHTSQIVGNDTRSPGLTRSLITHDDAVMTVNYATAEEGSQAHTGTQLRIAAYGPQAANVAGLIDQTDLFYIMRDALGLESPAR
ncbi:alkaline phosphatase [Croceibacterium mercuriale]|uniref:Alkaline phosphatase n=1 Tax=Croceibacterium mercuriale TaxID=1572751 RepID=A0A0B2C0N9_9SPHN|nr:alkaline phosphatase [Croceibacterium mercuriale]KHL25832.1 alkaline phosphatase [Croceibacterium mercuriale]